MKKILGLLTLVIITAVLSAVMTFFLLNNQFAERRSRDRDAYEQQIEQLENQVKQLEATLRKTALTPGNPAAAPASTLPPATVVVRPQPAVATSPSPTTPALPLATKPSLDPVITTVPTAPASPAAMVRYDSSSTGNKCRIDGTSSIHAWDMATQIMGGFFAIDGNVNLDPAQAAPAGVAEDGRVIAAAEVTIPVRTLKSYSTAMDEVYMDHMEGAKFRRIEYRLTQLILKKPHTPNTPFEFDSVGELAVHGVTNLISMPVKIERPDANALKISSTIGLKMTDYKVQPPSPTLGPTKITTGDDITITFQWLVIRSNEPIIIPVSTPAPSQ